MVLAKITWLRTSLLQGQICTAYMVHLVHTITHTRSQIMQVPSLLAVTH